ncbi:WcaF family extracellular polysaccharide biosynthesis acetyltransferase [Litoribacter ruber]|nr:WcaF family extracellular polysaccharide biosynthesis acetyltransferase [Litoribacter ruber]
MINQDTHSGPSFSLKNRMARIIWMIFYLFLFRYTPNPFHSWRATILRFFGAKVGKGVHVYPKVKIWAPWNLELEDYCGVANDVNLYSQGKITIGKKAVISQGAHLCAGTHDYTHPGFPQISKPINIGGHSWIAAEAFIHPGINIGEGAVIGARSVVTKNMPAWMVCSGHPCNPIKTRNLNSLSLESSTIFS